MQDELWCPRLRKLVREASEQAPTVAQQEVNFSACIGLLAFLSLQGHRVDIAPVVFHEPLTFSVKAFRLL